MKPIRTKLITILLTLCLCLSLLPPAALAKDAERAGSGKLIALTFDDGPCKDTLRLLDGLKQRGVKATFFMLGSNAAAYPDIVKRAYEEGHQIASHTYDHSELTKLSDSQIQSQVTRTRNALNAAIGAKNAYIVRPPYGAYNQRVLDLLGAAAIYWSVDSNDWRWTNNADKTVDEIMKYIEEKGVKNGVVLWPLRTAVSGKQSTPGGAFEIMEILGKEESLRRIRLGIQKLEA